MSWLRRRGRGRRRGLATGRRLVALPSWQPVRDGVRAGAVMHDHHHTTERDAALARLREVVKPGAVVYVSEVASRSRDTKRIRLFAVGRKDDSLVRITADVGAVRGLPVRPESPSWHDAGWLVVSGDFAMTRFLNRLSEALFGEPGQIRGEYL